MPEPSGRAVLQQARRAELRWEWEQAARLYRSMLLDAPQHPLAQQGLAEMERKLRATAELAALAAEGDALLAERRFAEAAARYAQAQRVALEARAARQLGQVGQALEHTLLLEARQTQVVELCARAAQSTTFASTRAALLDELGTHLTRLPDDAASALQRDELERAVLLLEQQLTPPERLERARAALGSADFATALRLLDDMPNKAPQAEAGRALRAEAQLLGQQLTPMLARADRALGRSDWPTARLVLDELSSTAAASPQVVHRWLILGLRVGTLALASGQHALDRQELSEARLACEQAARQVHALAQQAQPPDEALWLYQRALDIAAITAQAERAQALLGAQSDEQDGHAAALLALNDALARIERAERDGRSYAQLALLIEEQRAALEQEVQQLAAERQQLQQLQQLRQELQRLHEQAASSPTAIAPLLEQLAQFEQQAHELPELHRQAALLREQAQQQQQQHGAYSELARQAEQGRSEGNWAAAVALLARALQALALPGLPAPAVVANELERWQQALQALEAAGRELVRADHVRIGVLVGTLTAALLATVLLRFRNRTYRVISEAEARDDDNDGIPDIYRNRD